MPGNGASYDAIVIGAGHNGLTCAGYLARAGLKVKVVERRSVVGGAAVTEEFHPGFRNSVCSYVVSMLEPKVIRDLELAKYGFEIIERPVGFFLPSQDGPGFVMPRKQEEIPAAIARFSAHDADAYPGFDAQLADCARLAKTLVLETPPNLGGGLSDLWKVLGIGNRMRRLSTERQQAFVDLMTKSVGDYLDAWFDWDRLKGLLGFVAVTGNYVSPYASGSAYVLLHHAWGDASGRQGKWDYVRGGMGGITQAMARSAEARGVDIQVGAPVAEVIVQKGAACGVVLENGTRIRARAIVGNVNPKLLFLTLVDPSQIDPAFRLRIEGWRSVSATFRMNVALSELPDFTCMPGTGVQPHHTCSTFICPSLEYAERAYFEARSRGWASEPLINMCIASTLDDSLAPPGQHVASLFCQHFARELPGNRSWDDARDEAADLIIDTVDRYAPNFKRSVIARQILSPLDLEREFGLVGGDIFHGALHLDQLYSLRPAAGYADYRSPVRNLYMCGSGTHPGGGVTGAPGHNAAREIIRDFRRRRVD